MFAGENAIKCDCGKLIAVERDGRIFVWCKQCRKEVEICVMRADTLLETQSSKAK